MKIFQRAMLTREVATNFKGTIQMKIRLSVRQTTAAATFFFAFALIWGVAPTSQTILFSAEDAESTEFAPEYPEDAPIDVCPTEIVAYHTIKTIDFTDPNVSLEGWSARDGVTLSREERSLKATFETEDPYFFSGPLGELPSGPILLKLRVRRTNQSVGQIFFATAAHSYEEAHSTIFKLAEDDQFHDYVVYLDSDLPILRLRFDIGGDEGIADLERIDLIAIETKPLKFGTATLDSGTINFNVVNATPNNRQIADMEFHGFDPRKVYPTAAVEIDDRAYIDRYYPQKRPFEEMEVVAKVRSNGDEIRRRYFAFNESACAPAPGEFVEGEAPTLRCGKLAVRFAPDASGAEIFRDGVRVAVIAPLAYEEGDGADVIEPKRDYAQELEKTPEDSAVSYFDTLFGFPPRSAFFYEDFLRSISDMRLTPVFNSLSDDGREIEFSLCVFSPEESRKTLDSVAAASVEHDIYADDKPSQSVDAALNLKIAVGFLKFRLDEDTLSFEFDAPRAIHAPVIRVLGTMEQATLPGVEYLEKGEHSSSTADIKTKEHVRYAPPIHWITQPYAAITSDRGSVAMLYDDPKTQPIFAVPDFIDGDATSSRMNLCAKSASGKIRVAAPEPLENAILWAVKTRGLPEPPVPPQTGQAQEDVILAAFEKSIIATPNGWSHALFDGKPPYAFKPTYGSDFISTIWEITGEMPETPRIDFGGSHILNYAAFFAAGQGERVVDYLKAIVRLHAGQIQPDGSFRYKGKFLWGNQTDYASGNCGNHLYELGFAWSLTGNKDALATILKGCDFMNAQLTPRGAQVWELSLHTPDIMGASRCCMANVWAYEGTGDQKYLDAARRWAITGLPFVYLWEDSSLKPFDPNECVDGQYQPMMKYATIAVFGATGWASPNWMGRPVQWCGLDYAHALILLAKHDDALDWKKIAEGIVASAECQLCVKDDLIGLLPDSVQTDTQERFAPYINPCVVHMLRSALEGKQTSLSVVDIDGKRVAAPFPMKIENGGVKIFAKKGLVYQIMIDGEEIRTIESQGEDFVRF